MVKRGVVKLIKRTCKQRSHPASYGVTIALLICLLAMSVVQAAHFHKDGSDPHHACAVCAIHAPALASATIQITPPQVMVRSVHFDGDNSHHSVATLTTFIRPPPSV
jgi:hypothetical protein